MDSLQYGQVPQLPAENVDKMVAELTERCGLGRGSRREGKEGTRFSALFKWHLVGGLGCKMVDELTVRDGQGRGGWHEGGTACSTGRCGRCLQKTWTRWLQS